MLLNAKPEQISLKEDSTLLWQQKVGSPLPGEPVARLQKGSALLKPVLEIIESDTLGGADKEAVKAFLQSWLDAHIKTVLEPLVILEDKEGLEGEVHDIVSKVYESMGVIPRETLESAIATLTPEDRAVLRAKKIKLGPILVFLPALNKPAAVRLRALLWGFHHGRSLPMEVPKDGIVSQKVEEASIDRDFYQSIGYPVYGGRAIRIDMLDRVISAVYDAADKGKFQAQHKMAEWLGSPIEDLYAVLEAMGHTKIHDPADDKKAQEDEALLAGGGPSIAAGIESALVENMDAPQEAVAAKGDEANADTPETPVIPVAPAAEDVTPAPEAQKPEEQKKPALATFRLKRGKANEKEKPYIKKPQADNKPHSNHQKPDGKKDHNSNKDKDKSKGKRERRGNPKGKEYKQTMMVAEAKHKDDSPFAILEQLKKNADG